MKYLKDFRGYVFLVMHFIGQFLLRGISTFICRLMLFIRGIKTGRGNVFYGIIKTRRLPLSDIHIGKNNIFRSDMTSNLIGVNHKCMISTHSKHAVVQIGNNSGFSGVTIAAADKIIIGDHVLCGANTVITDFDWHTTPFFSSEPERVIIHDHVWLGMNSVVLKGVEIGVNSIIGANSVVVRSIPPNVVAAGNPCKVIRQLKQAD